MPYYFPKIMLSTLTLLIDTKRRGNKNGQPTKVPGLLIESIGQQAEWEAGQKRKQLRIKRKVEGF